MRKIAIVSEGLGGIFPIPNVNGGAIETWITDLIRMNDQEKRFEIDVFSCYNAEAKKQKFQYTKVHYFRSTAIEKFYYRMLSAVLRRIRHKPIFLSPYNCKVAKRGKWEKYDYILVENGMSIYEEIMKRPEAEGKMIYHFRNAIEYVKDVPWAERSDFRATMIADNAVCILAISDFMKRDFLKAAGRGNIRVFPNCVDAEAYRPADAARSHILRNRYNISDQDVVFAFSGRIVPEKGVSELIKAFKQAARVCPHAMLVLIGRTDVEGDTSEYALKIRKDLDEIRDRVRFTGFIDAYDMPEYYGMVDVVVAPTMNEEPFGMITLEAMATETPLIITDSGGMPEIVTDDCGIVVKRDNDLIENLKNAMVKLYRDPALRKQMGINGRSRVLKNRYYQKNYLIDRLERLFSELDKEKAGSQK